MILREGVRFGGEPESKLVRGRELLEDGEDISTDKTSWLDVDAINLLTLPPQRDSERSRASDR